MMKTVVIVPVRDNDGRPFPASVWLELEDRLRRFGGFTRDRVLGEWVEQGRVYRDRSRRYTVSMSARHLGAWVDLVLWAREAFRQEAMYIEINGVPEILGADG